MKEQFPPLAPFLTSASTAIAATGKSCEILTEYGFTEIRESDGGLKLKAGGKYWIRRGGSSFAAFILPKKFSLTDGALRIMLGHTDSPGLKVKVNAVDWEHEDQLPVEVYGSLITTRVDRLPVEVYGSPILSTWLDRPLNLYVHFADFNDKEGRVEECFSISHPNAVIPNPAIHLADLNNGFKYNPQFHLAALVPHRCIKGINEKRRGHGAVEMWLTDAQPPTDLGDGLINAPRLDNLASCYAGLKAICTADPKKLKQIPVLACFDLEECGDNFNSARGTLLDTVFLALRRFYQLDDWDFNAMCARSWMVSGDAAHAHHPNFPDLHDHAYAPIMGRGIVLKSHANQHYATTPAGEAFFEHHCRKAGLTSQRYVVRSDMRCGSTIGPACATRTGIPTIDVGIPLLAMHSIRETAHLNDIIDLVEFFSAVIHG